MSAAKRGELMKSPKYYPLIIKAALLTAMLFQCYPLADSFAQGKKGKNVWSDPVEIVRKSKPHRKYKKPFSQGQKEQVPLLTLQWQVFKQVAEISQAVDPDGKFYTGDRLQLMIQV